MKIDLTCPVELWQYAMPQNGEGECTFVMNNLSGKVVVSVQVTLSCFDQSDELLFRQTERVQGLHAGVGERFSMVILPSQWQEVEGVDLIIEKVWFDEATVWRKGNAPLSHYQSNAIPAGRTLDELRFVAGNDAVGYPQVQEEVWVCVCGRANALDSQRCCRCERRRDVVFSSFHPQNVERVVAAREEKLAQTARKAREDNNILQENRERQHVARRRRRRKLTRATVTLLTLAAAVAATVIWGLPFLRYHAAQELLRSGQYEQAIAAFAEMGDYRDAPEQVLECEYQKAESLLEHGEENGLLEAETLFLGLGEYRESAHNAQETSYTLAGLKLEAGQYEAAAERYQALGDYRDSADRLTETVYRQAKALFEAAGYQGARVLLEGLGTYEDAPAMVQACTYQLALGKLADEAYEEALEELGKLDPEYQDVALLTKQAHYGMAEEDMEAGLYEEAGRKYLLAGDYSDAASKASDSLYRLAQETKQNGEYEKAMGLFLLIPEYLDSEGQARDCVYQQAMDLMKQADYAGAAALLETVLTYSDAGEKLDECRFLLAQAALESGDAERAESLLESIVSYRGKETQLRKVRYQLAQGDLEKGLYEAALARFEVLGNYRDSSVKAKQCRYALAGAALEKGDFETAIAAYEALGSYKESRTFLEDARYQRAMVLLDAGDVAAAKSALEKMEDSKRARQTLASIKREEANRLYEAGEYEEAARLYQELGTKTDRKQVKACRYQQAVQLRNQEDLLGAGEAFRALGAYEDAAAQSEACYEAYYGLAQSELDAGEYEAALGRYELLGSYGDSADKAQECRYLMAGSAVERGDLETAAAAYEALGDYRESKSLLENVRYQQASDAMSRQDYAGVVRALRGLNLDALSPDHADGQEMYCEACYQLGEQLYRDGRPYDAIAFYQQAGDYRNARTEKLGRGVYLILGEWKTESGERVVFRLDHTCEWMGEALCYQMSNVRLMTGPDPDHLTLTHKLTRMEKDHLTVQEAGDGRDEVFELTRVGEYSLPEMPMTLPGEENDMEEEQLVTEDEDAPEA